MLRHTSLGLILLAFAWNAPRADAQKPIPPIVVDEEKDGLPGATVGPSRKDLEELVRAIGRDPVSRELVDRIDVLFRPRWGGRENKFEDARRWSQDPVYLAKIDAAARGLTGKPADTRVVLVHATPGGVIDEAMLRTHVKMDRDLEDGPRKTIRGRIVDDDSGRPIQGAVVMSQGGMLVRTDEAGKYILKTRPVYQEVPFYIMVEAPGFALTRAGFNWKAMPDVEVQDFRLPRAKPFGGRVVDARGKPIAGARLELMLLPSAVDLDGTMDRLRLSIPVTLRARTDKDGAYAFRNIPPDAGPKNLAYRLSVAHPKFLARTKTYAQNELLGDGWEITLEPGSTVRGVVVDDSGKPVAGAEVTAPLDEQQGIMSAPTTDAQGRFRLDNLPAGAAHLLIRSPTHLPTKVYCKAELGEPAELKITVVEGLYFEGKTVDDDGKPVAHLSVGYIVPLDAKEQAIIGSLAGYPTTSSRPDGTFRLGPVAKGRYRIRAIGKSSEGQLRGGTEADAGAKDVVIKVGVGKVF
jgi:Carboxypeptidase regulatory-like domain